MATTLSPRARQAAITANRRMYWLSKHWMLLFSLFYGLYVGLPFLAPVLMKIGWTSPARGIYFFYSFLCHQLPERSFFLFGPNAMYPLGEIQAAWQNTLNPLVLRQFVGNAQMGWKVSWSDRMVSMYTSVIFFAWIWYPLRKKIKPLPWWGFFLLLVPMGVDGLSHMVSDFAGIGMGFRDSNQWLANLTHNAFSASFYAGDALGSFNSWMRLITGLLFGLAVVWWGFPYLEEHFTSTMRIVEAKFARAGLEL